MDNECCERFKNLSQEELNAEFKDACELGQLETVKCLFNFSELKDHASYGFRLACTNGHLEIAKYLLTSLNLKKQADIHTYNDLGFRWACNNGYLDIIQFLIFDMNIEKTEYIQKHLIEQPNEQVEKMFITRELNQDLEFKFNSDKINNNKMKI